jgi:hypothetical protein
MDALLANAIIPRQASVFDCLPIAPKLATALATNMPGFCSTTIFLATNNLDFFAAAKCIHFFLGHFFFGVSGFVFVGRTR